MQTLEDRKVLGARGESAQREVESQCEVFANETSIFRLGNRSDFSCLNET